MKKISVIFGTRPEGIKLAPVILELRRCGRFTVEMCSTAQHRVILDQVLEAFSLRPDADLNVMRPDQSLTSLVARLLESVDGYLASARPDLVVVQGDTTTVMAASIAAYHRRIPVAHIEAGLRTADKYRPFPEEMNRRLTSQIAELHFAPTEAARANLLRDGVPKERIRVTGNTAIDAVVRMAERVRQDPPSLGIPLDGVLGRSEPVVLITGHRRESFGRPFEEMCLAVRSLAERYPGHRFVYPVHLNPNVREPVTRLLNGIGNVHLLEPLPYPAFVRLMAASTLILTDSGGVQEEAPSLGVPVVVMRDVTERPEGVEAGCLLVSGTGREGIVNAAAGILDDTSKAGAMKVLRNPFGDGRASERIVEHITEYFGQTPSIA